MGLWKSSGGRRLRRGLAVPLLVVSLVAPSAGAVASAAPTAPTCEGRTATVVGTDASDVLVGTAGPDVVVAGNGDDRVDGGGGNDVVCGGNGQDDLRGGDGDDRLLGENGDDTATGDAGKDQLVGGQGDDTLEAGAGVDAADGGRGYDACADAETTTACEDVRTSPTSSPLADAGRAPPGNVPVQGPDGVRLTIESGGGISPWDVIVGRDELLTRQVSDALASPAYEFDLPEDGDVVSARLTLPYREDLLQGFAESGLRIYHHDDDLGLWVPAGGEQVVDQAANTVSVTVDDFSAYAVFKLDSAGFERYWPTKEVFCLQEGDAANVGVDVEFLIDTSGSMRDWDPSGLRVDGALKFLEQMRASDRAGVIGFSSFASERIALTQLDTPARVTAVQSALESTRPFGGGTSISAAVRAGTTALATSTGVGRARVMLLMTDGDSLYEPALTTAAREAGITIHTIGLGTGVNSTLLQQIASGTGGKYLHLTTASQLPAIYAELSRGIIDDGTDADTDGLTDCEETFGVLTSYGFYDVALDPTQNEPFLGDRRVTSDPTKAHSDADTLTDGQEVRGEEMHEPLDLRDYASTRETYDFLIEAGITKYFIGRSLPRVPDSDLDTVRDDDETRGKVAGNGSTYTSRADRRDTDFDLLRDDVEYRIGTDPRQPNASDVGIAGLAPYTLFQHDRYSTVAPVVQQRLALFRSDLQVVEYLDTVTYDSDWDCVANCSALIAASADLQGTWCFLPWRENCSTEDKVRNLVQAAVATQGVFTRDGDFLGDFAAEQAAGECVLSHDDPAGCLEPQVYADVPPDLPLDDPDMADGPRNDNLDAEIASAVLSVAGGYRPRDMCTRGGGGVYKLVDASGVTRYIGQTGNFAQRRVQHLNDDRFTDLVFQEVHGSANRNVRRGLEQALYNEVWGDVDINTARENGSLNGQRPMSTKNPALTRRLALAKTFLSRCPGLD